MSPRLQEQRGESPPLRVLIADDVSETRRSTRLMLTLLPNVEVVAMAGDGRQAVAMAQSHQPDIVLMDVNMPTMDGFSAIREMLQYRPDMGCIVISAEQDRHTFKEAMAVGARGFITKPFTAEQLVDVVERVAQELQKSRRRFQQGEKLRQQRDMYLKELATEYVKTRRTDDKAVAVFEELAADPDCDPRWLMALALVYVLRGHWSKLKEVAARLEQINANSHTSERGDSTHSGPPR